MASLPISKRDQRRCLACSIDVDHTEHQHDEYLAIWCEQHLSWCGNHTHKSIEDALAHLRAAGSIQATNEG